MKLTTKDMRRKRVLGGKKGKRKIGRVGATVFLPGEPRVIGFIVKRPDILLMIKRKDKFLVLNGFSFNEDGNLVTPPDKSVWDDEALDRLGVDLSKCVIWEDLPIQTEDGEDIGHVGSTVFDSETGKVEYISSTDGAISTKMLGTIDIPSDMLVGFSDDALVVKQDAASIEASGGLAAKAGMDAAKAKSDMSKAGAKAGKAVDEGAYKLGGAIGKASRDTKVAVAATKDSMEQAKQLYHEEAGDDKDSSSLAKRNGKPDADAAAKALGEQIGKTKGMFAAFKEEYDKNAKNDR